MRSQLSQSLLQRLTRHTSGGRYLPEIDGLRFVAIAAVVLYHVSGYVVVKSGAPADALVHRLAVAGEWGVQVFFVISGFVLALPFARQHLGNGAPVRLRPYLMRRITRLEPPYILVMVLLALMAIVIGKLTAATAWPHLGASLLYVHNLVYEGMSVIAPVAWSLEVEVQFYLMAPLLAGLFLVPGTWGRRLAVVVVALAGLTVKPLLPPVLATLSLLGYLHYFLMGFLLADLFVTTWQSTPGQTRRWDAVTVVGWPVLVWLLMQPSARVDTLEPVVPFVLLLLFVAAFRGTWTLRVLRQPWVATIGGMCYSIYLLHYAVISLVGRVTLPFGERLAPGLHFVVQSALLGTAILIVSGVFFALVERPCMRASWPQEVAARAMILRKRWPVGWVRPLRQSE